LDEDKYPLKISLITPTFNSSKHIRKNINSVLIQDYPEIERIFVDNNSEDETVYLIQGLHKQSTKKIELIIIKEKDKGISDAFNKGINRSTGEIIGILNSDDFYLTPYVLSKIMDIFKNPNIDFVHGDMLFIDSTYGTNFRRALCCPPYMGMPYNHPTMFVRNTLYKKLGLFNLEFKFAMDFEWVCRLYENPYKLKVAGYYFKGFPIVGMNAGGASWANESKTLAEVRSALLLHQFYGLRAKYNLTARVGRNFIKGILFRLGLTGLVRIYRKIKWRDKFKDKFKETDK
jgi:glycosyltransferase involved in cell wall biosynthesis